MHLAAKGDGRLIVGATVEERGFDAAVTAGGVYALLEGARRAFPAIEEMAVEAIWTGFRPSSIDDAPILGADRGRRARDRDRPSPQRLPAGAGDGAGDRGAGRRRQPCRRRRSAFGLDRFAAPAIRRRANRPCRNGHADEAHRQRNANATARRPISPTCGAPRPPALEIAEPRGFAISLNGAVVRRAAWPRPRCATATRSRSSAPCREDEAD